MINFCILNMFFVRSSGSAFTPQHLLDTMECYVNFATSSIVPILLINFCILSVWDFSACDDCFKLVITCHILAASLELLDMHSLSDSPSPAAIPDPQKQWLESKTCRRNPRRFCEKIVDRFVHFKFNSWGSNSTDQIHKYSKQLHVLRLGCFY